MECYKEIVELVDIYNSILVRMNQQSILKNPNRVWIIMNQEVVKSKLIYFPFMIIFLLDSCHTGTIQWYDLIGVWEASDGAKFCLNKDSTCNACNINTVKIWDSVHRGSLQYSFDGHWSFEGKNRLYVYMPNPDAEANIHFKGEKKIYFTFEITGNGIFKNRPPWFLKFTVGDPDNMEYYIFHKIE
jgi:hypothetical protein